jgi:hypothetical protein
MDPRRSEFTGEADQYPRRARLQSGLQGQDSDPDRVGAAPSVSGRADTQPILPPEIPQFFTPAPGGAAYTPSLLAAARVRFIDAKKNVDETRDVVVVTPITDAVVAVDWTAAAEAEFALDDLAKEPAADASFADLPRAAQQAKNYATWTKSFGAWLAREQALELVRSPSLDVVSKPNESDRDFRVRLQQAAREARDARVAALRQKYAPKLQALQERLRRAEQAKTREQEQVTSSRMQAGISLATTVIGAMFGRKALSASTLGRATTAARGVGRSMKESQDVARAGETVAAVQAQIQELDASLNADIAAAEAAQASADDALETVRLKPKRGAVEVTLVALVWVAQ